MNHSSLHPRQHSDTNPDGLLTRIVAIGLQCLFFLLLALAATGARAVNLNDVGTGELLMRTDNNQEWQTGVQLGTKVDMQINGLVAKVTVEQRFRNGSSDWAEGNYVFPLPETAAVNAMTIRIGERIIVGEIHEKQAAKKIYEQAKSAGKRTALVEQRRPNLFASKVANIGPNEEISVTLTYLEKVHFEQGRFSLRFPMTLTPRYIPGNPLIGNTEAGFSPELARSEVASINTDSGWALPTDQVPDAHEISPYLNPKPADTKHPVNPIGIRIKLDAGLPLTEVTSAYHDIKVRKKKKHHIITLSDRVVSMDRDFELSWQSTPSAVPQAAVFTETVGGEDYALVMVVPPEQNKPADAIKREAIFIIDTSGSMGGASIQQARHALNIALGTLKPTDTFNIIEFNDRPTKLFPNARLASGSYIYDANRFVDSLQADGGTEMAPAIQAALENQPEVSGNALRQVVFITDGSVGNEEALFKLINDKLGHSRLFTVGIGSAPNSYFMRKAAQFGRGTFTYIGNQDEVEAKMGALFTQLESPVLHNIEVSWPGMAEVFPKPIPDLYSGQPLVITAKLDPTSGYKTRGIKVNGMTASGGWKRTFRLKGSKDSSGISTLWARDKISSLNDRVIEAGESDALRDAIIDVALLHKLVSRYTSFVAVDKTPARPVGAALKDKNAPNARPAGQSDQPFAYPQTATPAMEKMRLGLLSLAVAIQLWWLRRRDLRLKTEAGGHA